jgi:glycogenin
VSWRKRSVEQKDVVRIPAGDSGLPGSYAVLYLACNFYAVLGACASARSVLHFGSSAHLALLALRGSVQPEHVQRFLDVSPRTTSHWVDMISNPASLTASDIRNRKDCRYTKIEAWKLTQYDRVILLDTDTLAFANIDVLFGITLDKQVAAVSDAVGDMFNTGVLVLKPNSALAVEMFLNRRSMVSFNKGDQGFFNVFFNSSWQRLPSRFNVPIQFVDSAYFKSTVGAISVLHFTSEVKPWNFFVASTLQKSWKASSVPWKWFAQWVQYAYPAHPHVQHCLATTVVDSSRSVEDTAFTVLALLDHAIPHAQLARLVDRYYAMEIVREIVVVCHCDVPLLVNDLVLAGWGEKFRLFNRKSTNSRFHATDLRIRTSGVFLHGESFMVRETLIEYAFEVWKRHSDRLVGLQAEKYVFENAEASNLLSVGNLFLSSAYFFVYSCMVPVEAHAASDFFPRCDDILLHYTVAGVAGGKGNILVQSNHAPLAVAGVRATKEVAFCLRNLSDVFAPVRLSSVRFSISPLAR